EDFDESATLAPGWQPGPDNISYEAGTADVVAASSAEFGSAPNVLLTTLVSPLTGPDMAAHSNFWIHRAIAKASGKSASVEVDAIVDELSTTRDAGAFGFGARLLRFGSVPYTLEVDLGANDPSGNYALEIFETNDHGLSATHSYAFSSAITPKTKYR